MYPDNETRVLAHRIFSVVLVPSSVCPHPCSTTRDPAKTNDLKRTLSRTVSVFSSSAALLKKLRKEKSSAREIFYQDRVDKVKDEGYEKSSNDASLYTLQSCRLQSLKISSLPPSTTDVPSVSNSNEVLLFIIINSDWLLWYPFFWSNYFHSESGSVASSFTLINRYFKSFTSGPSFS